MSKDKFFKDAGDKLSKNEEILTKILTGEEHKLFREYTDAFNIKQK